ncbi:hypothetical protein JXJ21_07395 [candidate division KSB1 bacterium]|nr:hypothetical protein [candidate division KSB1 bacterium]
MRSTRCNALILLLLLTIFASTAGSQRLAEFEGKWTIINDKSSDIDLYGSLSLEIQQNASQLTLIQKWGTNRSFADTLRLTTGGSVNTIPISDRVFPTNVFMGLSMPVGEHREIKAVWLNGGSVLRLEEKFQIRGSQGESPVTCTHTYSLSENKELITYKIVRSTRKNDSAIKYILKKVDFKNAYYMKLEDGWEIDGLLPEKALLISLQGVANTSGPKFYFIYPENYPFHYTASVFDFYKNERNYTFTQLKTAEQAVNALKQVVNGYIVWDKSWRTSLIVAFTVAGLEKAIVVSEDQIPMVEKAGLKMVEDFRGKFNGQSDAEIYTWAYEQYWDRCNKKLIVWMGGPGGNVMQPGVADWGIYNKVFFNDLSTKPSDEAEYELAKKLLSEMVPMSLVMGWHSYVKDKERDHVKLTSNYGHVVEGLHTLPNMSFSSQVPASPGFKFTNRHNIEPGKMVKPKKKVYLACVQTDGLGIGAWLKPGRGEIPYAWEVIMNYSWMAPAMMEYFYTMATPNDYFIGCLSGPGYMYPKAVPPKFMPPLLTRAADLMKTLDLRVFEIMDYSEGATVEGNTELTKEVVDFYYDAMPDAIGFLNGYAPAYTFTIRDKKPLISYDYYLSPTRSEEEAVADLQELAAINAERPYFLLIHVRESSDVARVKRIISKLDSEFELTHLDIFLKMAGESPTFQERFLKK